ncbi:unnamed protein product [Kluyveromyces dobzhanskii CBS 2104]|uniref:WGS project CCBQ000000000 data, contig 00102 n=1 Tax=Kluyveromyces dobzhanskii CBS 2104 TaxID=1427455 RepID=A0A0A8L6U8_9SACH|nr:unnamed protein product [Kluyveromyces dobzhanskii CBS 2104]
MSSTEQWSNLIKNPYEAGDDNDVEIPDNVMDLLNSRSNSNGLGSSGYGGHEYPLPDENFESFNPIMNVNIEDFLTKELKDLDIPVLPKDELSKLDLDMFPGAEIDWNVVNDNDNDASAGENGNGGAGAPSITPRKLMPGGGGMRANHKKQASGTAIFGFTQHNKSLSIGSMTVNMDDKKQAFLQQQQEKILQSQEASQPADMEMSETIMQQQKELQLALQRQKEMNEKLENQLRMNKMQQEQLQRALEAQQLSLPQVPTIPDSTPARPQTSIIITSNGKNGKYQFPPPSSESSSQQRTTDTAKQDEPHNKDSNKLYPVQNGNGLLSPYSRASVNGSPQRRRQQNYEGVEEHRNHLAPPMNFSISSTSTVGNSTDQLLKMSKYFEELTENQNQDQVSSNGFGYNKKTSSRPPITPQDQVYDNPKTPSMHCNYKNSSTSYDGLETSDDMNSNSNNNNSLKPSGSNKHFARDSTISTASTIPMQCEDDQDSDHMQHAPSLGLGITLNSRVQLKKPPQLQVMPMIPGSSETTPLKQKQSPQNQFTGQLNQENNMPVKHAFQHTPTKKLIFDKTVTTSLRPDARNGHHLASSGNTGVGVISRDEKDEPECEFVQAQTPSPILRSQERFECITESPVHFQYNQFDLGLMGSLGHMGSLGPPGSAASHNQSAMSLNGSPVVSGGRNGKRYGMLPREEIDKYILELGPKQFQCKFKDCQKHFNRRYNARTHIQTHLCDRPYKCDFAGCHKAFVRNHDLLRHKKSHLEKGHSCAGCGKKFHSEDSLAKHQERKGHVGTIDDDDDDEQQEQQEQEDNDRDNDNSFDYYGHVDATASALSSPTRQTGSQVRKPVSPKKMPNVIRENIQRGHNVAALRMQEQLTYNQSSTGH